jgi:hypothetical protein
MKQYAFLNLLGFNNCLAKYFVICLVNFFVHYDR